MDKLLTLIVLVGFVFYNWDYFVQESDGVYLDCDDQETKEILLKLFTEFEKKTTAGGFVDWREVDLPNPVVGFFDIRTVQVISEHNLVICKARGLRENRKRTSDFEYEIYAEDGQTWVRGPNF